MSYQDDWRTVLTGMKSSITGFIDRNKPPENIGIAVDRFQDFVDGHKALLQNDRFAISVAEAFNNSLAQKEVMLSLPMPESRARLQKLMDAIDDALSALPGEFSVVNKIEIGKIDNRGNLQIGHGNTQNIDYSIQCLLEEAIDSANASNEEKTEAKDILRKFLTHPLVTSIAGGITGVLAGHV